MGKEVNKVVEKKEAKMAKVKFLPVTCEVSVEKFLNDQRDEKESYVYTMSCPFAGVDLGEAIRLTFIKTNNPDKFGRQQEHFAGKKAKGLFEFKAKAHFAENKALTLNGQVTRREFKKTAYVSIDFDNPFPWSAEKADRQLHMYIRKPELQAVFDMLAAEALDVTDDKDVKK